MCYRSQGANLSKYSPLFRSQIVSRRWCRFRCRGPRGPVGSAGVEPCSACFFLKTAWRAGGSVAIWASVKGASKALFVGRLPDAPTLGALGCAIPIGTAGTGGAGTAVLLALAAPLAPKPDIADMNAFSPPRIWCESTVAICSTNQHVICRSIWPALAQTSDIVLVAS